MSDIPQKKNTLAKKCFSAVRMWLSSLNNTYQSCFLQDTKTLLWSDRNALRKALQIIIAMGILFVLSLSLGRMVWFASDEIPPYFVGVLLVMVILAAVSIWLSGRRQLAVLLLFLIGFLLRLGFVLFWDTPPVSDFELTYTIASDISKVSLTHLSSVIDQCARGYNTTWSVHMPFIFFEAFFLWILGDSVLSLQVVFALFSALSCVMTAMIAKKLFSARTGVLAGLLMVFNPVALFFTPVLTNQHPATFFFLAAVYLFVAKPISTPWLNILLCTLSLAFSQLLRPEMYIVIIAFLCYAIFLLISRKSATKVSLIRSVKQQAAQFLSICLIFFAVIHSVNFLLVSTKMIHGSITESHSVYKIAVGLNQNSLGHWSEEDDAISGDDAALRMRIQERMSNPFSVIHHIIDKLMYQFSSYNYDWSIAGKTGFVPEIFYPNLTIAWMMAILFLTIPAIVKWIFRSRARQMLLMVIILGYFMTYAIIEIQDRYSYLLIPFFTILAAESIVFIARDLIGYSPNRPLPKANTYKE